MSKAREMITLSLTPAEASAVAEIFGEKAGDLADRIDTGGIGDPTPWLLSLMRRLQSDLEIGVAEWNAAPTSDISRTGNSLKDEAPI